MKQETPVVPLAYFDIKNIDWLGEANQLVQFQRSVGNTFLCIMVRRVEIALPMSSGWELILAYPRGVLDVAGLFRDERNVLKEVVSF